MESIRRYSTAFRGRDSANNIGIFKGLATVGRMNAWKLSRSILDKTARDRASLNQIRAFHPVIFRRLRRLMEDGFVEVQERAMSEKGVLTDIYGLTLKGSLAALLLVDEDRAEDYLRNTAAANPINALALSLMDQGVDRAFVEDSFVDSVRESIERGIINVDLVDYKTLLVVFMAFLERFCDYARIPLEQRRDVVKRMLQLGFTELDEKTETLKIGEMLGLALQDMIVKGDFDSSEEELQARLNMMKLGIFHELSLPIVPDEHGDLVKGTLREVRRRALAVGMEMFRRDPNARKH